MWRSRTEPRAGALLYRGAITLLLTVCSPASAQQIDPGESGTDDLCLSDSLCRAHFARARKLSKSEDFEGALAAYQIAHRRREVPWLLINIGRTLQKLGRPKEAIPYFQQYLSVAPPGASALREKATEYLKDAEQEVTTLAATRPSKPVLAEPPKSEVPSEEPPPSMPEPAPAVQPVPAAQLSIPSAPPPLPPVPSPSRWRSPGFIAGITVSSALLISGALAGGLAISTAGQLRDTAYVGEPGSEQSDLQQRARSLALAADVLIPVGVAALGTTVLVTALRRPQRESRPTLRPMAYLGAGAFGVSVSRGF